jgi:hypothetical protein
MYKQIYTFIFICIFTHIRRCMLIRNHIYTDKYSVYLYTDIYIGVFVCMSEFIGIKCIYIYIYI